MKIEECEFFGKFLDIAEEMYRSGWDERNGGNLSVLIDEELDAPVLRTLPLSFDATALTGKCFMVTGTGKYFRNVKAHPGENTGIIRIGKDGKTAELLWGYEDGGTFTSELPAHLLSHIARLNIDPENRVIMHCHPEALLAMTYVHPLDTRSFTHSLWQMETECIVVFPDGVEVLPWMLCGTDEIGRATADCMTRARTVVWALHGVYGAGKTLDEAFGLIETVEKAASVYMRIAHLPRLNTITDENLRTIAVAYGVTPRTGILQ